MIGDPFLPPGLDTPALVVDLDIAEANTRRLIEYLAPRGIALRPHAKTHKSIGIARGQLAAAASPVTEIRSGTYVLGDRQQATLGAIGFDEVALHVAATVVSTAVPGQVIFDAGAKTLTKDRAPYLTGHGLLPAYPDAVIERVNDYHGIVRIPVGTPAPHLGEVVAIMPNHVCPVVDLFDVFTVVRGERVVGTWPVDARGRRN